MAITGLQPIDNPSAEPLLERAREVSAIDRALDAAVLGRGGLAVVEGPAGIGKTRLLREARQRADTRGMRTLVSRGAQLERDFPFGVVRQLFERPLAACEDEEREQLLSGAARFAAAALTDRPPGKSPSGDRGHTILHGLYWLTANLAGRNPVLVVLDDVQWSDPASLRWIAYMSKRLEGLPVVAVAAIRTGDTPSQPQLVHELLSDPSACVLRPSPLSEEAAAELVRADLSADAADEFCTACHAMTGGNPFFLRELLLDLAARGLTGTPDDAALVPLHQPSRLSRILLATLERVSEPAAALARAVAVIGGPGLAGGPTLADAGALAGLDEVTIAHAAVELERAELLRGGDPPDFVHPLVRAAVYSSIVPSERARAKAAVAQLLRARGAPATLVASHLMGALRSGDPAAVEALASAAESAMSRGAHDEATRYLRRAVEEPPPPDRRGELLLQLGIAEVHAGVPGAVERMRNAIDLVEDPRRRAEMALRVGNVLATLARWRDAAVVVESALADLGGRDEALETKLEGLLIEVGLNDASASREARARLTEAAQTMRRGKSLDRAQLASMAVAAATAGQAGDLARDAALRAVEGAPPITEENVRTFAFASMALSFVDELETARRLWDRALEDARDRGSVIVYALASCFRSDIAYRQGALREAEADARAALGCVQGDSWGLAALTYPVAFLIDPLIETGDIAEAAEQFASLTPREIDTDLADVTRLLFARGRLRLAQDRLAEGVDDLLRCGAAFDALGARSPAARPWRSTAAVGLMGLGQQAEASRLARDEVQIARECGSRRALGMALRAHGVVEVGERQVRLLGQAVSVLDGGVAPLELARALVDRGAALRRRRKVEAARVSLRRGLDLASRLGARVLAARAETELLASGARPRRRAITGPESLTASERRVADMAAQGRTNREIAQALFVTEKTIEVHLGHSYRKLGIRSRSELSCALNDPVQAQS